MATITLMDEAGGLARLFAWLSPTFPIGGFAYSQGLETAIVQDRVRDRTTLIDWVGGALHAGTIKTDAQVLAIAHRAVRSGDAQALADVNALSLALQVSAQRDAETREQARSFLTAARAWALGLPDWLEDALAGPVALPAAIGALAGHQALPLIPVLTGFVSAFVSQQISVAVRLVPLGQSEGLATQAALEPRVVALARSSQTATIGAIGGLGYACDIAAMAHEDQEVRIFRS